MGTIEDAINEMNRAQARANRSCNIAMVAAMLSIVLSSFSVGLKLGSSLLNREMGICQTFKK